MNIITSEKFSAYNDDKQKRYDTRDQDGRFNVHSSLARGKDTKAPELKPIGQVEAKDSFRDVMKQTTSDILSIHRVPLELMSIRREGITSAGDLNKVDWMFHKNELLPLADSMTELNSFAGTSIITINDYMGMDNQKETTLHKPILKQKTMKTSINSITI